VLGTGEGEIGRIRVCDQPGQIVHEILSPKLTGAVAQGVESLLCKWKT
jgi:hypothetical protein